MIARSRVLHHLPALLLFAALTLWVVWPLCLHPATTIEPGDPELNSYILSWDIFALFHRLGDFFQANVYWPNVDSLAYGETMLTQMVMVLPVAPFTPAPAALHNISLMEGYFFCAAAAYCLGWHFFRSRMAATVAGIVYAFAAYRIVRMGHVQLVHGEFLPLMILGFEWTLQKEARRIKRGSLLLGFAALAQWLCSWYWTVFTFWTFAPYMAARWFQYRRSLRRSNLFGPLLALFIAGMVAFPATIPFFRLHRTGVLLRPPEAMAVFSATPRDFLLPGPRSLVWSRAALPDSVSGANSERYLFPGLATIAGFLAALAACVLRYRRKIRRRHSGIADNPSEPFSLGLWSVLTLFLLSLCFGTSLAGVPMPLHFIGTLIPGSEQMRAAGRWMLPALMGIALMATWSWQRWFGPGRPLAWRRAGWIAIGLLTLESLTIPVRVAAVPARPDPFEAWLGEQPGIAPTLILPDLAPGMMIHAAMHRQPLVNGTNGYFPAYHRSRMKVLGMFPDFFVTRGLRAMRVRYVAINLKLSELPEAQWRERLDAALIGQPDSIKRVFGVGDWLVAELLPPPARLPFAIPTIRGVTGVGVKTLEKSDPAGAAALDSFVAGR